MRSPKPSIEAAIAVATQVLRPFIKNGGWTSADPPRRDLAALTEADAMAGKLAPEGKRKRGERRSYLTRDLLVLEAVRRVRGLGFALQRNAHAHHRRSACAIVSEAFARLGVHMSDLSIEQKYLQRRARWTDDEFMGAD
jgi:hypothetical protein